MQSKCTTIGIVGMAKNTGKTTTAIKIMEEVYRKGIPLGLTGIGYDGEEIDNVTFLPKPRYYVRDGTIVATAERCMHISSAKLEVLARTGIHTALGEVIIGEVKKEGRIVIAGPNTGKRLNLVINKLKSLGNKLVIVDGAINRVAPMSVVDALILTTGAARDIEMEKLAYEIKCISKMFSLPLVNPKFEMCIKNIGSTIMQKKSEKNLFLNSLLNPKTIDEIVKEIDHEIRSIAISGVVVASVLLKLVRLLGKRLKDMIVMFCDPIKLLVSGNPDIIFQALTKIECSGGKAGYLHLIPLIAITVNPFYPKYLKFYQGYEPAYVDGNELLLRISQSTYVPVIEVMTQNGDTLLKIINQL